MTVKRYNAGCAYAGEEEMIQVDDGAYVSHEDYAELLKERDALAAENSTIKTMNDCLAEELRGYESDGAFDGPDMHKLWHSHAGALPATDAAIASIHAQGVDMFVAHIDYPHSPVDFTHGYVDDLAKAFASQLRKESNHD